jgi:hypothetical protein
MVHEAPFLHRYRAKFHAGQVLLLLNCITRASNNLIRVREKHTEPQNPNIFSDHFLFISTPVMQPEILHGLDCA